jgi:hypothetical protein
VSRRLGLHPGTLGFGGLVTEIFVCVREMVHPHGHLLRKYTVAVRLSGTRAKNRNVSSSAECAGVIYQLTCEPWPSSSALLPNNLQSETAGASIPWNNPTSA